MKKLLTLLILPLAFMTNAMAQSMAGWTQDPVIKETHWFGVYEYEEYPNQDYGDYNGNYPGKTITFDDNYLQSIEIIKYHTGQNPNQRPKTTFYSWLDHKYRFSVENTQAWGLRQEIKNQYQQGYDGQDHYEWDGMGLCNITDHYTKLNILNLKAGDKFSIEYYLDRLDGTDANIGWSHMVFDDGNVNGLSQTEEVKTKTDYEVTADCNVCINVPKHAIIRNIVIRLKEYQVADFDVLQLTEAEINQYDPQHHFGQIGYRYFFKNPGVLEDKRGAAPYITMKFGADNDMTFVRALSEPTEQWNLAETEATYYSKETFNQNPTVISPDNQNVITVQSPVSTAETPTDWDSQFWIAAPTTLTPGQTYKVEFKYKANKEASVDTQSHLEPGNYVTWQGSLGTLSFTTEWQEYTGEVTVSDVTNGAGQSGMQSIAFNLNKYRDANTYYFKDIKLYVPERTVAVGTDQLAAASIIDASNDFDPDHAHFQYHDTYAVNNDLSSKFSAEKNQSRLAGKEWSTFSADHDYEVDASLNYAKNGDVVFGDVFNTIWPKYGNFFYFFPEVDGLLHIEFYCEGSEETPAFWYKQKEDGTYPQIADQPSITYHNLNGANRTNGNNHYSLEVEVEKGGVYYLCSLPTDMVHERPTVRLKSYAFIPKFVVKPLYKVVKNDEVNGTATQHVAEITGGPYTNLDGQEHGFGNNTYELTGNYTRNAEPEARVKCLGNVVSATAKVEYDNGKQYLSFYNIKFREGNNAAGEKYNPGGAVVAHVENSVGQASFVLTVAYDAAEAKWNDAKDTRVAADIENKVEVKHWDFYSGKGDYNASGVISDSWDLGKYKDGNGKTYADDQNGWKNNPKLYKEIHKADGLTSDWEYDYVDIQNSKEPIYKSVYDMEADNADMIHETAGLVFFTDPNEICLYNENDAPTSEFQDRYVGLLGGGKLIIPRLKADDRVVIKMGCFGNVDGVGNSEMEQEAVLTLTNAKDAKGKVISGDYIIGGSTPYADETSPANTLPHGEYHFIVNETSNSDATDFAITVKDAALLKIYSIDIYRNAANNNADILTENKVTSETPELLIAEGDGSKNMDFFLRYRGYEEKSDFSGEADQVRGNLALTSDDFTSDETENKVTATFDEGDFGSFRAEMAVKTKDDANTYVTDYAPGTLAVGYLETMTYPYTWDFTDLSSYVSEDITAEQGSTTLDTDFKGWNSKQLRNAPEEEPGILFANGGELYASDQLFAEAAGIGFKRSVENPDEAKTLNNSVEVASDGLVLNSANGFHKLFIPKNAQLPQDVSGNDIDKAVIYVRATPIEGATVKAQCSHNGTTEADFDATITADDDVIYVMNMPAGEDAELWLNGMKVKKIGVSIDPKKLNKLGWATESRERVIDPELTAYLTGQPIKSYYVSAMSAAEKKVTIEEVDGSLYVMPLAMGDKDPQAYILHNADGPVTILDEGFHLFVPDMHDNPASTNPKKQALVMDNFCMKAQLYPTEKLPMYDGEYTNYVLTYNTAKAGWTEDEDNRDGSAEERTEVGFYRVQPKGVKSIGHQGYLQFATSDVKPGNSGNFFALDFDGDDIDSISNTTVDMDEEEPVYYNLQGQKLNGQPTQHGIYIAKGKKFTVK